MDLRTAPTSEALALVSIMVLSLIDHPAEMLVYPEPGPDSTTIHITTSAADTGKIVGKQGRTARSLRTILAGHSARVGKRFTLNIVENRQLP